jgi:hypothetical protein
VSNFISSCFLLGLDNFVSEERLRRREVLSYHRYVDDCYLLVEFPLNASNEAIGNSLFDLHSAVADYLAMGLGLRLNPLKSDRRVVANQADYEDFIQQTKFVSFGGSTSATVGKGPQDTLKALVHVVSQLESEYSSKGYVQLQREQDNTLKECWRDATKQYLKSKGAQRALEKAFSNWNPILTLLNAKALMFLIGSSDSRLS